jgi:hypothetical protein
MLERLLVNFFYAQPVGHAIEALHYALGHHAADPDGRRVSVALNAATATELAGMCSFIDDTYAIDHPFVEACPDSAARLAGVPRPWDWVLDDFRRAQDIQLELFAGMRDYYAASDQHLTARVGRGFVGSPQAGYVRGQQLRLEVPEPARRAARALLGDDGGAAAPLIAVMPAGSSERSLYPSCASWLAILDALADAHPGARFVLVGKLARDARTSSSFGADELATLLAHHTQPIDAFDRPLAEQLAAVEACDLFLSPHTGFGLAALSVATPWLTLSGGRWFEYFFNDVPFRSVIPDTERYGAFSQFDPAGTLADDAGDGPRTPSMSAARIREDLPALVEGAGALIAGTLDYETALRDYFAALLAAHGGDASRIWSIDGVHLAHMGNAY